jgi:hypothetical protein
MLQVRTTASLANTPRDIREGFQPGIEIGVELARNSVQRQEGFAQEEKVERQLPAKPVAARSRTRRIASVLRQRNPDGFPITLEQPRQDLWRWLVAGDAVKTECDERVAQRCGEPARQAPVQKHEPERGMFLLLHNAIGKPGRLFVGLGSASGKTSPALLVQSDNFSVTNSVTGSNSPERVSWQQQLATGLPDPDLNLRRRFRSENKGASAKG